MVGIEGEEQLVEPVEEQQAEIVPGDRERPPDRGDVLGLLRDDDREQPGGGLLEEAGEVARPHPQADVGRVLERLVHTITLRGGPGGARAEPPAVG